MCGSILPLKSKLLQNENSDARLKVNIRDVDSSSLSKIMLLRPVRYDFIPSIIPDSPELMKYGDYNSGKNRVGFLAQDFIKVFPDLVKYDSTADIYSINYVSLIPYLVKSLQEQQSRIETLQNIVTSQEQEIISIKDFVGYNEGGIKKSTAQEPSDKPEGGDVPVLYQNSPNPFYDNTEIKVFLPDDTQSAKLYIHNLNGTEVMVKDLTEHGDIKITVNGSSLQRGMYLYTLTVNGKMVDSKRMILTE